jgi:putative transposase
MTLSELDAALHRFIVDDYHHREHSETGEAPRARWEADGFVPQLPEHVEDLDLLLLTVPRPRFVHPDGIRFQGLRYLDVGLAAYVGESVTVRYDPRDLTEVRVFHKDLFVCRATCAELATTTISLKDLVAARNRRRRELRGEIGERRSLVEELLAVHQPAPPRTSRPGSRLKRYRNE